MELTDRVTKLEDEVKIVKNEVQAVLLDIRESYLNRENPFNPDAAGAGITSFNATISGINSPSSEASKPPANHLPPEPEEEPEPLPKLPDLEPIEEVKEVAAAEEESAAEEVNEAMRSEEEPEVSEMREASDKKNGQARKNGKMNMTTIAGLTKWVSGAVGTLGRERTETVLDFAEMAGHLPPDMKTTLVKFVARAPTNGNGHSDGNGNGNGNGHIIKAGKLVTSLIELESLLGMQSDSDELTLLAMVCQEVDQ